MTTACRAGCIATVALSGLLLIAGCGAEPPPAARAPDAAEHPSGAERASRAGWPPGALALGRADWLRGVARRLAGLGEAPLVHGLTALAARLRDCEHFVAHDPDGDPAALPGRARCAGPEELRALGSGRAGGAGLVLVTPVAGGTDRVALVARGAGLDDLEVEVSWAGSGAAGVADLWRPATEPPGAPRLSPRDGLAQIRIRPAGGIDLAALVPRGSQADRLFALKSELLSGAVLAGVWELALYPPSPGTDVPLAALGLDLASVTVADLALTGFVRELEAVWPIRHQTASFGRARGACFDELRILPQLAPCYALRDDLLVVGWNRTATRRALAETDAPSLLDERGGAAFWLDRVAEADRAMARVLGRAPRGGGYGWQRALARPSKAAPGALRWHLELRGGTPAAPAGDAS